jgi:hypothetical protein
MRGAFSLARHEDGGSRRKKGWNIMKLVPTVLSAALIAGMSTVAMAQSDGGGAGGDVNPHRFGKGTDANPTSPGANPKLGNSAASPAERLNNSPYGLDPARRDMNSSDVSGHWNDRDYRQERIAPNGTGRY